MRVFDTGATRDTDAQKLDYEGFLSPIVLEQYAKYMHKNRIQADGSLRDSDNWQKGIPQEQYMKSLWRHFMEAWGAHRRVNDKDIKEALCAMLFNTMGYLFEELKRHDTTAPEVDNVVVLPVQPESGETIPDGLYQQIMKRLREAA